MEIRVSCHSIALSQWSGINWESFPAYQLSPEESTKTGMENALAQNPAHDSSRSFPLLRSCGSGKSIQASAAFPLPTGGIIREQDFTLG